MRQQSKVPCRHCQTDNHDSFTAEIALHFRGLEGLEKPIVWVFPDISVCLDCGDAHFNLPTKELEVLRTGAPVEGASVFLGSSGK